MQWSRIGLFSIITMGCLALSGVASAGDEYNYNDSYNGAEIRDIPAVGAPGMYRTCHRMRHHHQWRHHCGMYRAFYVCKMYTYEITPQHRDVACSKWKLKWKRVHHGWHHWNNEEGK